MRKSQDRMERQRVVCTAFLAALVLVLPISPSQTGRPQQQPSLPSKALIASSCRAIEVPLGLGDPFALVFNPVNDFLYVLRTGTTAPQAAVLHHGRPVATIDFPTGAYRELTSVGVNPTTGLVYVPQWGSDTTYLVRDAQRIDSYRTGYWGPAGVWPSASTGDTYVSGKWFQDTSKVAHFDGTTFSGLVSGAPNANPSAGAVTQDGQDLYLANSYSDTVSVVRGTTLWKTIHAGDHPNGVAFNPANGYVYVANRGTAATLSTVSVISGTTAVATVTLGLGYDEYLGVHPKDAITLWDNIYYGGTDIVAVDPGTGLVYISNWGGNTVSVISETTLLATLPVGTHPNSIVFNPVTRRVYVANTGDDTVTIIAGTDVAETVQVGDYPIDLAVDTHSGLVYVLNRYGDSLSVIRCEDSLPERRVLGHYVAWYKTPTTYGGPGCSNPAARGAWRMWNMCEHNPDNITGTHGFRDIAVVHYPLTGPYDSADPKIIEYDLLQALAAEIDTFVIDYYGENDAGGVDQATLQVLEQVEEMDARYGEDFRIALMYDEGTLDGQPDPLAKATADLAYILHTYAPSPTYLWAEGKPVLFYFPKGPILSPNELAAIAGDFALVYLDLPADYLPGMNGSYSWVKGDPWMPDGSNWGEPYLRWYYPSLDFYAATIPTLTFGIGGVWAGFDDLGVGEGWSCFDHRWIDRQDGQVYDWTWDILNEYNAGVGTTYTLPISWVQLNTLNDYMEGTTLFASVEVTGVDGIDCGYGYGYQYVQKTEDHALEFKGLPGDSRLDIFVAQHIYNARLVSSTISNTGLLDSALSAFHSGQYTSAMILADEAAGIPPPADIRAGRIGDTMIVSWQDQPGAVLMNGHRISYGLESGRYLSSTTVLTGSSVVLHGFISDATYYVAITTLGATNPCETWYVSESWYSDEKIVPPAVGVFYLPVVVQ